MIRKIIILSLFLILPISGFCQYYGDKPREFYMQPRYINNIFFSIGGGGQTYLSEHYRSGNIEDHISPEININVGKFSDNNILEIGRASCRERV